MDRFKNFQSYIAMEGIFHSWKSRLAEAKAASLDKKIEFWITEKFGSHGLLHNFCSNTKDLKTAIERYDYSDMDKIPFTYKMIAGIAVAISDEYIIIGRGDIEDGDIDVESFLITPNDLDKYIANSLSKFKRMEHKDGSV